MPKIPLFLIVSAMTENRFERAYQEYKREKEQLRIPNNRFDCLKNAPLQPPLPRESAGRFECLVDDYYPRGEPVRAPTTVYLPRPGPPKTAPEPPKAITETTYLPKPEPPKQTVTYLPRPEPPKSDPTPAVKPEPWRRGGAKKKEEPVNDINFHFPALGCKQGELPKAEIKLPESRAPAEMIVKPVVVPNKKPIMTLLCYRDGKMVSREVYEDGTELPEDNAPVIIKRPKYTSWASVLKKNEGEIVYYDEESKK